MQSNEDYNTNKMVQSIEQVECSGCFNLINERYYLSVNDRVWHINCLRCVDCKLCLDSEQSCFAKDGFIYCKEDYFKRFPRKCHSCCQQLSSNELIMKARHLLFHIHCFKCLLCDKQLNPGDEFAIDRDGFTVLCRTHYHLQQQQHEQTMPYNAIKSEPSLIPYNQQYNQTANDSFLFNQSTELTNSKGRPKKRKLTTEQTTTATNKKQAKSKLNSENTKNNIKLNCATTQSEALTNNNILVNQQQQSVNLNIQTILSHNEESSDDYRKNFEDYYDEDDDNNQTNQYNDPDEDEDDDDDDLLLDTSTNGQSQKINDLSLISSNGGYYDSVAAAAAQRQKRMRTSFKHHQLRVMKSYFELNHNPDAKDLKQLSQKTGLSKRVLQVWFQNARAKFRRGQGGPCDQMNNNSHQLSPNSIAISSSSLDLNMNLRQENVDETSSQSLHDPNIKNMSSSSSSSSNIDKQDINYSMLTNSANNPLFHQQQQMHHHLLQQQQQHQQLQPKSN